MISLLSNSPVVDNDRGKTKGYRAVCKAFENRQKNFTKIRPIAGRKQGVIPADVHKPLVPAATIAP
jgi:hypothetical protein